jgi:cyclopropane fatty-acyl-phospholipid synthase-like methyltransferase
MWYRDWFRDSNYLMVYQHRDTHEAEQMLTLIEKTVGIQKESRILDLGCGSGRHSLSLAKRGYEQITGVDLSPTLLEVAEQAAKEEGLSVRFEQHDMRNIPDNWQFDLVMNLFTSFGYFETDEENSEVIGGIKKVLVKGGWLVMDFFNSQWLRHNLISHDERIMPDGRRLEQTRWIEKGRVEKRLLLRSTSEAVEFVESVRMFTLEEFKKMFEANGLRLKHLFGGYDGSEFHDATSPRLIMFAERT